MSAENNLTNEKWRQALRETVGERGLSQSQVARRAGISKSQLSRVLNGKSNLTANTFEKLASVLGLTTIDLVVDRHRVEGTVGTMSELNLALQEFPHPLREGLQRVFWGIVSTTRQAYHLDNPDLQ